MLEIDQLIPDQRISQAYPPNSKNNSKFVAPVHDELKICANKDFKFEDIRFRPAQTKKDIAQLKLLQKEWFPIEYQDNFYQSIVTKQAQSMIAEIQLKYPTGRKETFIIGAMVYQCRPTKSRYYGTRWKEWFCSFFRTHYGIYIMTIGVINEFRGKGIADYMLNSLKQQVKNDQQQLKYIYLDMVVYNESAGRFYQKNGFTIVRTKRNHYSIENQPFDAVVYLWMPN